MKVLVLASEPISADQLRAAVDNLPGTDLDDAEIKVVAPALHSSALKFWMGDADEAIAKADAVKRESVAKLGAAGVAAEGDTGEGDPMKAIEDALRNFDADRILVFSRPESEQRYREGVAAGEVEERFGRPVEHVELARAETS